VAKLFNALWEDFGSVM
jgi:hypothetical protein